MTQESGRMLKKAIFSLTAIIITFIVAFYEVPAVARDVGFYYFLFLLSYGFIAIFFSDVVVRPNFQNLGQKLAFLAIPVVYIVLIVIARVIFNIFDIALLYFIVTTLLMTVLSSTAIQSINKAFVDINQQEEENRGLKIAEGVKKIRLEEIAATMKENSMLMEDRDLKHQLELLQNAVRYGNPGEIKETQEITKAINNNIETIGGMIGEMEEGSDIAAITALMKKTRLMLEEKDKITQLYYK
ncbi:hypothetical protein [Clostridium formicaceticum]|uniref:Uncharacterized protein n=1 Tax=Clostridium formicaceticum TaxID=1497 RepID=A0AAC9WEW8_9CLOT|nr:hypothetical protein [Clostridium formicaceticum]AOY75759.1 hypothetical protein BJL90_07515 [Clostridium formicaceticum]ARE86083.1 hypothetical protein CLFO_03990 [Clostridium formicaceticum]